MKKNLIKMICVLIFIFHVIFHVLYLAPVNPATGLYASVVDSYMNTFFSQNWHLFAPEPAIATVNLNYRCSPNGDWENFLQPLFKEHKSTLITSLGKQGYVYQHLTREIYNAEIKKADPKKLPEWKILNRVISDRCQQEYPDSRYSEFNTERIFTKNFSDRHKNKHLALGSTSQLNFTFNYLGETKWNSINQ